MSDTTAIKTMETPAASRFPACARDANGRFLPGAPGRMPGQRNLISGRAARHMLRHYEARQDELLERMQRWWLPQYMQMITRLLPKNGAEGSELDDLDAAARVEALRAALAEAEAEAAAKAP